MTTELTDNLKLSGTAAPDLAGEDERILLKSLTERAQKQSLNSVEDRQMLATLLATRLGRDLGQPQNSDRLVAYGERLSDLEPSAILAVFERCSMECKFFPQVSEIREMAGAHSQQLDLMDVDRAWFWINTYLKKHGVEGRDYVESESVEGHCPRCNDTRWITTEVNGERTASRCDC